MIFERTDKIIKRSFVQKNRNILFLFGDNLTRKGLGGQAKEMRGEVNCIGICSKKYPSNDISSFMTDKEYDYNCKVISKDIDRAISEWNTNKYNKIIVPPIGIGLAKLPQKAPMTWEFLQNEFERLKKIVESDKSILQKGIF